MEYHLLATSFIVCISLTSVWTRFENQRAINPRSNSCGTFTDCYTCTSRDCQWCPLSEKCYRSSSPNKQCGTAQSINNTQKCSNKLFSGYNPVTAYENVLLTAVANTNKSSQCLKKLFPEKDYNVVATVSASCDDFLLVYPNCYAYVGITHSDKIIFVAYRGTKNIKQLIEEGFLTLALPKMHFNAGGRVQIYFLNAHIKLFEQVKKNLASLKSKYPGYKVLILGHSLGGAIASLASVSLVYENVIHSDDIILYTFGMPRVGDRTYAEIHDRLVPNSYRLVHHSDIVVHLPIMTGNRNNSAYHHGKEVFYPKENMTIHSDFKICRADEDKNCSDGTTFKLDCLRHNFACIRDHRYYFGINVSKYCDSILKQ